jgi:hypothetical protein
MKAKLLVELRLLSPSKDERPEPHEKIVERVHTLLTPGTESLLQLL